jgi:hypothetical protein
MVIVTVFGAERLDGVVALCVAEGWSTFPFDPDQALHALLASGTTTVVALDADGEVIGFAHALSNGVTSYLAHCSLPPSTAIAGLDGGY